MTSTKSITAAHTASHLIAEFVELHSPDEVFSLPIATNPGRNQILRNLDNIAAIIQITPQPDCPESVDASAHAKLRLPVRQTGRHLD